MARNPISMARLDVTRRRTVIDYPYALNFPGTNGNHMHIGTDVYLYERTQPWSIAFWIMPKRFPGGSGGHIFAEYQSSAPFRGRLVRIDTGVLNFWLINTFGSNELKISYQPPPIGQYTRVAIAYDGSSSAAGVRCKYNNVLQTQVAAIETLSATIVQSSVSTRWGGWGGAGVNLPMLLAAPAILDYSLTDQNIADDWYKPNSGATPIDVYGLTEGSGTNVASTGTGAHAGTLGAGVTWVSANTPMKARSVITQNRLSVS